MPEVITITRLILLSEELANKFKNISNSNTAKDKLTATKELQKSIQQKEVSNERVTQEEIDNIYKTL
ncbi:hypothetical protein N7280_02775 [Rickettsia rhipicephali]|uniref:hypothetical protein n=1 Tax=Rickettsia rhipicephali TaxID=33992 RepID=UPI0022528404|nr:hypothetical protein [Rickettsia rhipicephali]MCX4079563.1 hypothetical protein [Rickettsia rhipicephali]